MPRLDTHERCILRLPDAEIREAREGDRYALSRLFAFQGNRFRLDIAEHKGVMRKHLVVQRQLVIPVEHGLALARSDQAILIQEQALQAFRLLKFKIVVGEAAFSANRAVERRMGAELEEHLPSPGFSTR